MTKQELITKWEAEFARECKGLPPFIIRRVETIKNALFEDIRQVQND